MTNRLDHKIIASLIQPNSTVLDVGCGRGDLMDLLRTERQAHTRGLEIDAQRVSDCLARGLSVVQGNANRDLQTYPENAFDYVILSRTIQEMSQPDVVLTGLARLAPQIIVSFMNFGHWKRRVGFGLSGRIPRLPGRAWYEAESLHPCTAKDFAELVDQLGLKTQSVTPVRPFKDRPKLESTAHRGINLFSEDVVFVVSQ